MGSCDSLWNENSASILFGWGKSNRNTAAEQAHIFF